jgi:hypothetical protein
MLRKRAQHQLKSTLFLCTNNLPEKNILIILTNRNSKLAEKSNYRRLNMKGLKLSNNKLKGSKFKRKLWVKNKLKIEANARYGYKEDDDEEKESSLNHNLIASSSYEANIIHLGKTDLKTI